MNDQLKNALLAQKPAESTRAKICHELRWSEIDYSFYQYEQGHKYLMLYLKADEFSVRTMERSRIFWNWWKNHWNNRDLGFLEFASNTTYSLTNLREFYQEVHNAEILAADIYPSSVVLTESYALMISELVAAETTKP